MVSELSYETVSTVIESWELLRQKADYATIAGTALFIKFFALCPEAKTVFGFARDTKTDADFYQSPRFLAHARHFVKILDSAFDMLGPDLEMLTEILLDLGEVHQSKYGVKPEFFPFMGQAILESLEDILGSDIFKGHVVDCWLEVYGELTKDMKEGMTRARKKDQTIG